MQGIGTELHLNKSAIGITKKHMQYQRNNSASADAALNNDTRTVPKYLERKEHDGDKNTIQRDCLSLPEVCVRDPKKIRRMSQSRGPDWPSVQQRTVKRQVWSHGDVAGARVESDSMRSNEVVGFSSFFIFVMACYNNIFATWIVRHQPILIH